MDIYHFIHFYCSTHFMLQDKGRGKEVYWALVGLQKIVGTQRLLESTNKQPNKNRSAHWHCILNLKGIKGDGF